MNSRRSFLKTGLVLGGTALAGTGLHIARKADARSIAEKLVQFLDEPDMAKSLGMALVTHDKSMRNMSINRIVDSLFLEIGISRNSVSDITQDSLLANLHTSARTDFIEENIVLIDGWILSRTEAYLCALLYLFETP
jgi:hypothetical protein